MEVSKGWSQRWFMNLWKHLNVPKNCVWYDTWDNLYGWSQVSSHWDHLHKTICLRSSFGCFHGHILAIRYESWTALVTTRSSRNQLVGTRIVVSRNHDRDFRFRYDCKNILFAKKQHRTTVSFFFKPYAFFQHFVTKNNIKHINFTCMAKQ